MAVIKKKKDKALPAVNTSALPDIVFMLLFFFMVATVMREVDLKVTVNKPQATEIQKLERKSLVTYIYAGAPRVKYQDKFGRSPRVQLNDAFASLDDIQPFVIQEREQKSEEDAAMMTMSIKADKTVKMGLITDIKLQLRKAQALKINYSSNSGSSTEGAFILQLGADNGQTMIVTIGDVSVSSASYALLSDLDGLAVSSQASAAAAITGIDNALTDLATRRADLGAYMNRLAHSLNNAEIYTANMSDSNSRIQDTDYAKEMTELSRVQIVRQAGMAMLSQANAIPSQVLQLLQ
jgi:flagellin-like hook-associated protein FlgL